MAQYEIRKYQSKEKISLKDDLKLFKNSLINLSKNLNFVLIFFCYGKKKKINLNNIKISQNTLFPPKKIYTK